MSDLLTISDHVHLLKLAAKAGDNLGVHQHEQAILALQQELEALNNPWVSIEDALPEESDYPVLLCNIHGTVIETFFYDFDDGLSGDCGPSFWDKDDIDWLDLKYTAAWMSVPALNKGEQ